MGWTKPNTTAAEFYRDRLQCEQQSLSMYPVAMTNLGNGYQAPAMTNCTAYGNQVSCMTTPGSYTPPQQIDINMFKRSSAFSACMRSMGYLYRIGNSVR